jgi:hypothetical protein
MFERLNRRLEALQKEIDAGPKLKPGFFLENGKLGYAPVVDLVIGKPARSASFDPMTEPLHEGDLVEILAPDHRNIGKQGRLVPSTKNYHGLQRWHVWAGDERLTHTHGFAERKSLKLISKCPT